MQIESGTELDLLGAEQWILRIQGPRAWFSTKMSVTNSGKIIRNTGKIPCKYYGGLSKLNEDTCMESALVSDQYSFFVFSLRVVADFTDAKVCQDIGKVTYVNSEKKVRSAPLRYRLRSIWVRSHTARATRCTVGIRSIRPARPLDSATGSLCSEINILGLQRFFSVCFLIFISHAGTIVSILWNGKSERVDPTKRNE